MNDLWTELTWLPHNTIGHSGMAVLNIVGILLGRGPGWGKWLHKATIPASAHPFEEDDGAR